MYDEFICEAIPLILSGNEFKEHNREQLARARDYWKREGNIEQVKRCEEAIKRYY